MGVGRLLQEFHLIVEYPAAQRNSVLFTSGTAGAGQLGLVGRVGKGERITGLSKAFCWAWAALSSHDQ